MDIVRMRNGLGNQMFCYGLYKELQNRGRRVEMDLGFYSKYPDWPDKYCLEYVFPKIKIRPLDESIFNAVCDDYNARVIDAKQKEYFENHPEKKPFWGEKKEEVGCFREDIFNTQDCAFVGIWFSEKYFSNVRTELRGDFQFRKGEDKLLDIGERMRNEESVSINIRLGRKYSYINMKTPNGFEPGNIVKDGYYLQAIEKIKSILGRRIKWYVFTDAIDVLCGRRDALDVTEHFVEAESVSKSKDHSGYLEAVEEIMKVLNGLDVVYINNMTFDRYEDWYDMYLMSCARHNIIANSSFGWWGAWLNSNEDKVVIAPKKFLLSSKGTDICPENWIRV